MIPAIFVSSTIADLHHLRDAIRDAIEELSYRPIMSEYGEVGYLNPFPAAEGCYQSVAQCQMVILLVGARYGSVGQDGLSVTHREFYTARENGIPTISFVEPRVISFKEIYDCDTTSNIWTQFKAMDNPKGTFRLLDDIRTSPTYNAILPCATVGDTKRLLKLQIADFVGNRLAETGGPFGQQIRDLVAEVKTLRSQIIHGAIAPSEGPTDQRNWRRFYAVSRLLLDDSRANYRKLLEELFEDFDLAVQAVSESPGIESVLKAAGYSYQVVSDAALTFDEAQKSLKDGVEIKNMRMHTMFGGGTKGAYAIFTDKSLYVTQTLFNSWAETQGFVFKKSAVA